MSFASYSESSMTAEHLKVKLQTLDLSKQADASAPATFALEDRAQNDAAPLEAVADPQDLPQQFGALRIERQVASLDEQLAVVGLGRKHLTAEGRARLRSIAGVSERLGLTTTDKSIVLAAVTDLRKQQWTAEDTKAQVSAVGDNVKEQIRILRAKLESLDQLSRDVGTRQAAQEAAGRDKEQRRVRVEVKSQNYAEELAQLESRLRRTGFVPEISHDALLTRSARLAALRTDNEALRQRLELFGDLPPNPDAAAEVFAAAARRLEAATRQFEDNLSQL